MTAPKERRRIRMTRALRLFTPACGLVVLAALWAIAHGAADRAAPPTMPKPTGVRLSAAIEPHTGPDPDEHVLVLEDRCRERRAEHRAAASAVQAASTAQARASARSVTSLTPRPVATTVASTAASTPSGIQSIIRSAFAPLGSSAVAWALRVSQCESGFNPRAVNVSSSAEGLFQFLPSTWAISPYAASSPFDPVANASAAAWLYSHAGPEQWACK
jgi:soluble lytic murein transglycosylase-like protein